MNSLALFEKPKKKYHKEIEKEKRMNRWNNQRDSTEN
jgi:hypothetical protein